MRSIHYLATLESDVVTTARGGTVGGHACFDYLPGAVFLGACAGRVYSKLSSADAFTAFHSGRVRFLPAVPTVDDRATWPVPLSFHTEKRGLTIHNLAVGDRGRLQRPQQVRSGYLTPSGQSADPPERRYGQKVASHRKRSAWRHGRDVTEADENALFGYEALAAGTVLSGRVDLDDVVPESIEEALRTALFGRPIRAGRSRRTEYGRVVLTESARRDGGEAGASSFGDTVLLLCVSDLALGDPNTGQPTLRPAPEHFGLSSGRYSAARSFVRSRAYSPFNGHRRRPDPERQIITQGSVLAFERVDAGELKPLVEAAARGFGRYREAGLGQVTVNPGLLAHECLTVVEGDTGPATSELEPPGDALMQWLQARNEQVAHEERDREAARRWEERLRPYARRSAGPGRSQWRNLVGVAATAGSDADLVDALVGEDGLLLRGVRQRRWAVRVNGVAAVDALKECLEQAPAGRARGILQLAAYRIAHGMSRSEVE